MAASDHPSAKPFVPPTGTAQVFSLHLNGANSDYVLDVARERDITRNRAVNVIIDEHRQAAERRARRNGR